MPGPGPARSSPVERGAERSPTTFPLESAASAAMGKPSGVDYGQWRKLRAGKCELAPAVPVCRKRGLSALQGTGQQLLPPPPSPGWGRGGMCPGKGGLGKAGPRPPDAPAEPTLKMLVLPTLPFHRRTPCSERDSNSPRATEQARRNKIRVRGLPHLCTPIDSGGPQRGGGGAGREKLEPGGKLSFLSLTFKRVQRKGKG